MWDILDAQWQKLVWGRKNRCNKHGEIIFREARVDLRNDATGEIINLTATVPPEGDLEREVDLSVQRRLASRTADVQTNLELKDLLREQQRLEGELETLVLKLAQARDLAEAKASPPAEAPRGEPS